MRPERKRLRYYIINPASDRRLDQRFESREDVVIRFGASGKVRPGTASDIGRMGLRLETDGVLTTGDEVEIAFPGSADGVRCFGRVVWTRRVGSGRREEAGVALQAWYGIVLGENSWRRFKGAVPRKDRRNAPR